MQLIRGDARRVKFDPGRFMAIICSPPFFRQRDYKVKGQIGQEGTIRKYIRQLVRVFDNLRPALHRRGTLWIEIGDKRLAEGARKVNAWRKGGLNSKERDIRAVCGLKEGDLAMIPAELALALRKAGWHLRSEIVLERSNPQPEALVGRHFVENDEGVQRLRQGNWRPTTAESRLFMFSNAPDYYVDQFSGLEPVAGTAHSRGKGTSPKADNVARATGIRSNESWGAAHSGLVALRNLRNVWHWPIPPREDWPVVLDAQGEQISHHATYPVELAERILSIATPEAGCCSTCGEPWCRVLRRKRHHRRTGEEIGQASFQKMRESGQGHDLIISWEPIGWKPSCGCGSDSRPAEILDPFIGSGSSAVAAQRLARGFVGVDLNPDYLRLAAARLAADLKKAREKAERDSAQMELWK